MTRKELIKAVLEKNGRAMTVDELEKETGITAKKLRQVLTPYSIDIVRAGDKIFDLSYRIYPGKTFRYTPTKIEIEKGLISAEDDLHLFLTACFDYSATITLVDEEGIKYVLPKSRKNKNVPYMVYAGFIRWYRKNYFQHEDDILVTCLNWQNHIFSIKRCKKQDRDQFLITIKNRNLANMVFDILNHSYSKYEQDLFLVRKYLFIYPFNQSTPPDQLEKALRKDKRFLISRFDKMLLWTGHLLDDWLTIGLKKYYYKNDKGEWAPVSVISDEYGRYGFCNFCAERMKWSKDKGWRHLENEADWGDVYLDKTFFKEGLLKNN